MKKGIICLSAVLLLLVSACAGSAAPSEPLQSTSPSDTEQPTMLPPPEVKTTQTPEETSYYPPEKKAVEVEEMELTIEIPVPDVTGLDIPGSEAIRFTETMKVGWNLGNTLDSNAMDWWNGKEENYETAWCGIKTTQEMIDAVKRAGFNTIRLPVSWSPHVDGDYTISEIWLNRVQEVVDYAWRNGMTVIINIHHDNDVKFMYPDSEHYEQSSRYVKRIWEQVAARFSEYDERLIFETLNEPRLVGTRFEWWQDMKDPVCIDAAQTLNKLNQDAVDTIRAAGGYNKTRYLMIPGLGASPESAAGDAFKLPNDTVEERMIVSVHAYTPYNFALQAPNENGSVSEFDMNQAKSTQDIDKFMNSLYEKYIKNGIPVVLGEFGARAKGGNLADRTQFAAYYVASARARGMTCIWWDNNLFEGDGELFGLLNRSKVEWYFPDIVAALTMYS